MVDGLRITWRVFEERISTRADSRSMRARYRPQGEAEMAMGLRSLAEVMERPPSFSSEKRSRREYLCHDFEEYLEFSDESDSSSQDEMQNTDCSSIANRSRSDSSFENSDISYHGPTSRGSKTVPLIARSNTKSEINMNEIEIVDFKVNVFYFLYIF